MKISKSENCGNSPKDIFIEQFVIELFEKSNLEEKVDENIFVELAYTQRKIGFNEFYLGSIIEEEIMEVFIYDAISHGKKGAIDIKVKTVNNNIINFGLFLEFKSLKADKISYIKIFKNKYEKES